MTRTTQGMLCGLLCLLTLGHVPSLAQERSPTGRHKQKVQPLPPAVVVSPADAPARVWRVRAFVGNLRGGDLFGVRVVSGNAVPWVGLDPGGFQSSRFKVRFENNPLVGLECGRDIGQVWRLVAGFSKSTLDVSANALVGQTGGQFRFDRFGVMTVHLGFQRDLVALAAAPYLLGDAQLTVLDPTVNTALGQTQIGWRVGLGYRQPVGETTSLFLEGALSRIPLSSNGFSPQAQPPFDPETVVDFRNQALLLGFHLGVEARF